MVVPALTVKVAGEKEKLDKVTEFAETGDAALEDVLEGCEEYPEQPETSVITIKMMTKSRANFFMLVLPPFQIISIRFLLL